MHTPEYLAQYYKSNKQVIKERSRAYYLAHKEEIAIKKKQYHLENRAKIKEANYKRMYGISTAEYHELAAKQDYKCAICGKQEIVNDAYKNVKPLSVDHCHSKGHVRGLLCNSCNIGLGMFKDNIESLKQAIKYLE